MLKHDLTLAARMFARDAFFSSANLVGLVVGLAAAAFVFLFVRNEFGYDRWIPGHETLYRIDTVETVPGQSPVEIAHAPGPLPAALQRAFPEIVETSRGYRLDTSVRLGADPVAAKLVAADPNFLSLLGLPMVAGSAETALATPSALAISRGAALRYFGTADAVGRRLTLMLPDARDFEVAAVFEDLPDNSHLDLELLVPLTAYFASADEEVRRIPENWGGAYFHSYARLRTGTSPADFADRLPAFVDRSLPQWLTGLLKTAPHEFYRFRFVAVADIHFDGAALGAMRPPSDRAAVLAVALIAGLILSVACVNFANLTMARSTLRAREVALRKLHGADRLRIFSQFAGEALLVTSVAGLLALALVEVSLPWLSAAFGLPAGALADDHLPLALAMAALVFITALGASLYPSLVIARLAPARVFARDAGRSSGGRLRNVLVVAQFAVAIGLIATVAAMALQTRFVREAGLGFARERMMILRVPDMADRAARVRGLREALAGDPRVAAVAVSSAVPTDASEDNISISLAGAAKPVQIGYHQVDSSFFGTYGVAALAGRTETPRQDAPEDGGERDAVINQSALRLLGHQAPDAAIGRRLRSGTTLFRIVGVVPDVHFRSLHESVRPELFALAGDAGGVLTVRGRSDDLPALVAAVERIWRARFPERAIDRAFLDEHIDGLYGAEARQAKLLTVFAVLAILLCCSGLLAMAAFAAQRRTREIAIRKVMGARTGDILRLLLWQFTRPVLVANLIAWPIAFLAVRDWLDRFAYRIELPVWIFPAAGAAALTIALLAVGRHALLVARTAPAQALRRE